MPITTRFLLPSAVLACGLAMSVPARADLHVTDAQLNPVAICQSSLPATDAQVRPKATGFRNESTTKGAFVICGYSQPTKDGDSGLPSSIQIYFHSIDGADRTISCTAVTGVDGLWPMIYSTKTVQSAANGTYGFLAWGPGDFGGTSSIPNGYHVSVTCDLPPQTSIIDALNSVQYEIGD
ncbi:MAG: hypothetical protein QM719_04310 [Thermomonas sp.]